MSSILSERVILGQYSVSKDPKDDTITYIFAMSLPSFLGFFALLCLLPTWLWILLLSTLILTNDLAIDALQRGVLTIPWKTLRGRVGGKSTPTKASMVSKATSPDRNENLPVPDAPDAPGSLYFLPTLEEQPRPDSEYADI